MLQIYHSAQRAAGKFYEKDLMFFHLFHLTVSMIGQFNAEGKKIFEDFYRNLVDYAEAISVLNMKLLQFWSMNI